eukprot:CAMPEP_0202357822 /NCGR_PEP_ID=MMETSP1126-20121109/11698_1 /ASSEMBLY_ACC=CAM_ASM_000457 /TAXON_ID=3047 /ORGANISM="Dunaliella tertiolecta, Strain CCMP1320" /LENGTH=147 /DNA_ID=CAMNT_0048950785 /DNA_START=35 /DNA_END=475 /DNA_ORIENTATION=+
MELHHKLRRDPTWHKDACNLCGQLGHRASECTSGTVNWRQIYGDNAFILRPPVYWSEELAAKKARQPDAGILEKQAREYAKTMAEQLKLDYDEMMKKAESLHNQDPSVTIPRVVIPEETPLPSGWASATDPQGRTYYYHKKTMKTQW